METKAAETVLTVQRSLEPYIRPREEVAHIRQILAAHLSSCVGSADLGGPLALVDLPGPLSTTPETRGLQREYLKALSANTKALKEFEAVRRAHGNGTASKVLDEATPSDLLEEHLGTVTLQKKQRKLQAVDKYMRLLNQKPAAADGFLSSEVIFKDTSPLPVVPKDIVNSLGVDKDATNADMSTLLSQLEKSVLRAKLLQKREERLLEGVKSRSTNLPGKTSNGARFQALTASRNELIAWIENELGRVSDDELEPGETPGEGELADKGQMEDRLARVREKYKRYLAARRTIIQILSQPPTPALAPPMEVQDKAPTVPQAPPSNPLLLSPYLEKLLLVAHEQKGFITQKAHLNITLAKQLKDSCQVIDRLAEESQLLPSFPLPGASRRKPGIGDGLAAPETMDVASRMKRWVFAAESAKIATLENVAEKIEEAQLALEDSMKVVGEIDRLLGRSQVGESLVEPDTGADDIWLSQGQSGIRSGELLELSKKGDKMVAHGGKKGDVWSILDGNLGIIKSEVDYE